MEHKSHQIPFLVKGGNKNQLHNKLNEICGVTKDRERKGFVKFVINYNSSSDKIKGEHYLSFFAKLLYDWIRSHNEEEAGAIQIEYDDGLNLETINIGNSMESIIETLDKIEVFRKEFISRRNQLLNKNQ